MCRVRWLGMRRCSSSSWRVAVTRQSSIVGHVRSMMHVSRWLEASRLDAGVMNEELNVKMLDELHRDARALRLTPVSMRVVLGFLRSVGVVPPIGVVACRRRRYPAGGALLESSSGSLGVVLVESWWWWGLVEKFVDGDGFVA